MSCDHLPGNHRPCSRESWLAPLLSVLAILMLGIGFATPALAQPSNENCGGAIAIGLGVTPFDTTGSSFSGTNLAGGCSFTTDDMFDNDVFFCFTAPTSGSFEIEVLKLTDTGMVGPPFDPRFAVLDGCACPPSAAQVLTCGEGNPLSTGQFDAVAGNNYLIIIGSFFAFGTGAGEITISSGTPPVEGLSCDGNPAGADLTWSLPAFGPGVSYDGGINVYRDGQLEATLPGTSTSFSFTAPLGFLGSTSFCVEGVNLGLGASAQSCCTAVIGGPDNDDCVDAIPVALGQTAFDSFLATLDGPSVAGSCPTSNSTPDVWFRFTPMSTQVFEISLCNGTAFNSTIGLYSDNGTCPPPVSSLLDCNDDFCGEQSRVLLTLQSGADYLIQVSGQNGQSGPGILSIQPPCFGPNALSCSYDCALQELDLTWSNGQTYTMLEVERDGVVVASLPGSATSYQDTSPPNGLVSYTVRGSCANGSTTEASCDVPVLSPIGPYTDLILPLEVQTLTGVPGLIESAPTLAAALELNGRSVAVLLEEFLSYPCLDQLTTDIAGIWVTSGTFPFDRHLSSAEGDELANLAAAGAVIYLEGGDHWAFNHVASQLDLRDGINEGLSTDGDDSFDSMDGTLAPQAGLDTSSFQNVGYSTDAFDDNDRTDRLELFMDTDVVSTEAIWMNDDNSPGGTEGNYVTGVVAVHTDGGVMISSSWEFGGFDGDPAALAATYLSVFPSTDPDFIRGDCNNDGSSSIADAVSILGFLFPPAGCVANGTCPTNACDDACDANDDGSINLTDAVFLLGVLFPPAGCTPGTDCPEFPEPAGQCGPDPTIDAFDCALSSCP